MTDFRAWLEHRRAEMSAEEREWMETFRVMTLERLSKIDRYQASRRYRFRQWLHHRLGWWRE